MGSVSVPVAMYIAAGAAVVGAGAAAYESHEQGVAVQNANKAKARVEALNATQRSIQLRQNMLRALASQNATAGGAVGTGGATSFGANTRRQLTEGQNDLLVGSANSSAQISLLDEAGRNAKSAGDIGAVGDLASGVKSYASITGGS